jgi:hypothetical protein
MLIIRLYRNTFRYLQDTTGSKVVDCFCFFNFKGKKKIPKIEIL